MKSATHPATWAGAALLFVAACLLLASYVPAYASDHQTSSNTKEVNQHDSEKRGEASGDGKAVTGKASATSKAIVKQRNIQRSGPNDNVTQTATNDATVDQYTSAESGDAHAEEGGSAKSGNAKAKSMAVVTQMNIQIVAGRCDEDVHQDASNEVHVEQWTSASSGDAHADSDGSAKSGDSSATNKAKVHQRNMQLHKC